MENRSSNTFTYIEAAQISQLIYRISKCLSYKEFIQTLSTQIKYIIPYKGIELFEINASSDGFEFSDVYSVNKSSIFLQEAALIRSSNPPFWFSYMATPITTILKSSDNRNDNIWVNSPNYKKIYQPLNIYYSLYMKFAYDDSNIGIICLYREKDQGDFSEREMFFAETLKTHFEFSWWIFANQFRGSKGEISLNSPMFTITKYHIDKFNLTKKEIVIVNACLNGEKDSDICSSLDISKSTLEKHLHNIYVKTGTKNRTSLFQQFTII